MHIKIGSVVAYKSITTYHNNLLVVAVGKFEISMQLILCRVVTQTICPHNKMTTSGNDRVANN